MAVFCLCTLYLEGHAKLCYCDDWKIDHFASLMSLETKNIRIKSAIDIYECNLHIIYAHSSEIFVKKINNWRFWKTQFLYSVGHLGFFPILLSFSFASSQWKSIKILGVASMGQNFDDYSGFQPRKKFRFDQFYYNCPLLDFRLPPYWWGPPITIIIDNNLLFT